MSQGHADALLGAAKTRRNRVIIMIGLFAGLRVSEITGLRVENLDLERGLCTVRHGKGDRDRVLPIAGRLQLELESWIGDRKEGWVVCSTRGHGRLSARGVQAMIKSVAVRAGLPSADQPRKFHPHLLRHFFACRLLELGATIIEVRDLLGHSSVATTQVYLHTTVDSLRTAVNRL